MGAGNKDEQAAVVVRSVRTWRCEGMFGWLHLGEKKGKMRFHLSFIPATYWLQIEISLSFGQQIPCAYETYYRFPSHLGKVEDGRGEEMMRRKKGVVKVHMCWWFFPPPHHLCEYWIQRERNYLHMVYIPLLE